jgi:hypothetical protein
MRKMMAQMFYNGESPQGIEMLRESSRGLDKVRRS